MTGTHHEDQQPKQPARINPVAIIAGALASLSAAVVASYFGVAGTLIGAAVVSVVSSLAAALYAGLLGRGQGLVQRTATTVLHTATGRTATIEDRSGGEPAQDHPGGPDQDTGAAGEDGDAAKRDEKAPPRWSWRRSVVVVGVAAVLIFAIAIGAVSGIEAAIKEPIASALGVRDKGQARTSVGVAVDRAGGSGTTGTSAPTSSTQAPPSTGQPGQTSPPTTAPPAGGGSPPPSTTAPPTTSQPSVPSSSNGTPSGS